MDGRIDAGGSRPCDTLTFGKPQPQYILANLISGSWGGITLRSDGLEAYLHWTDPDRKKDAVLYRVTRKAETDIFGSLEAVEGPFGEPLRAIDPALSPDGLSLYYTVVPPLGASGDPGDIWVSRRNATDDPFGPGSPVRGVNSPSFDGDAFVSRDGTMLYFASERLGNSDIFTFRLGQSLPPDPLISVNGRGIESTPILSASELTILFASSGTLVRGPMDIFAATRVNKEDGFGDARKLDFVSTKDWNDYPEVLSEDGCTLWVTSSGSGISTLAMAVNIEKSGASN